MSPRRFPAAAAAAVKTDTLEPSDATPAAANDAEGAEGAETDGAEGAEGAAGDQGAEGEQTENQGGEPQASHPPDQSEGEEPQRRRGGRPRGSRNATAGAAPRAQSSVELSDAELQDLGALTRMALKQGLALPDLVAALETQIAAYHKAMY